jgi:hypothetical protein
MTTYQQFLQILAQGVPYTPQEMFDILDLKNLLKKNKNLKALDFAGNHLFLNSIHPGIIIT